MPKLKQVTAKNEAQRLFLNAIDRHDIIFAIGSAGTGKTHIAVAAAAALVKQKWAHKIVICRPARGAGQTSGFLPGDLGEKLRPLMTPIYDILGKTSTDAGIPGYVELCSFEYMRGRTFDDAIVIVDEVQNATFEELEMVLTRLGKDAKMFLTGDPAQSDLKGPAAGALPLLLKLLAEDTDFPVVHFTEVDNLRHPLVAKLTKLFAAFHTRAHKGTPECTSPTNIN